MDRVKRIWYLSPMRAEKVQASLRIRAVSPKPSLLAHTSSESRGTFRQKARSLAPLNGWACAVGLCHDGMLEDTNSLDGAHICFTDSNIAITVIAVFLSYRAYQRRTPTTRQEGNIRRMTDVRDDDDDMSTYNGNSTQQM